MKAFLVKLTVVFLLILFSSSISLASEISPEAEKLLDQLHVKAADIKSLSWEIENKPSYYTTNIYYKQGGFIRMQTEFSHGDYPIDYLITPEKSLNYNARTGEITEGAGMNIFSNTWFFLPLLDKNTLKSWGDVTVKKETIENKNYVVLEISFKTTPRTRSGSNWKHGFYFDTEELKLEKVEHSYGHGSTQILKVKEYKKIGEYDFPVKIEGDYTSISVSNIRINPDLSKDLFEPEYENALTYFSNYSEEEINYNLSKNPDNPDLHYTLAKLLGNQKREFDKAIQEYKKTIILKPNARAAYFGLAQAYSQSNKKEEAIRIYQESIDKFPESINHIYQMLVSLYRNGPSADLDKALELTQQWLKKEPDFYLALMTLAGLLEKKNRIDEACRVYEKLLENPEIRGNLKIHYKTALVKLYLKQDEKTKAEKLLKDILEQEDVSYTHYYITQAQQELLKYYQAEGKLDKIKEETLAKIKENPNDTKLLKQLAEIYKIESEYQKTVEIYEKIISLEPDNRSSYQELANLYRQAGKKEKQVELYETLIKKFPSSKGQYLQQLMSAYQQAGRNEDAIKTSEEYIKESPENAYAYSTVARLYNSLKNYDKAIEMYRKAIELEQNTDSQAQHLIQIGQIYTQQKKYDKAEGAYEEAKTKSKQEWVQQSANSQITQLYQQMGKTDKLIDKYEAQLNKEPENFELLKQLAEISSRERQYEKCIELYKKALEIKPDDKNILNQLAYAYRNTKKHDEAIEIYEGLIAKFPENKQNYLSSLVSAYQQVGRNEDAIKTSEEYIKESPENAYAYSTVARLYNSLKDYDKAIQFYRKTIELEQNTDSQAQHLIQIGQIYTQQKKYKEAEQAYEEAKTKSKQKWVQQNANQLITELYRQMGNIDKLTNKYEAKLKEEPENAELLKQLAEIYSRERQYEKAVELYEKLITKFPENKQNYLSSLMSAYQKVGRNEDAIKTSEELIKERPDQAHAYATTANLYRNLKDYDKAIQMYRKAIELEQHADNKAQHLMQIGRIYFQQKKYKEAEQAYEEAKTKSKQEWVQRDANRQIAEIYGKMSSRIKIDSSTIKKGLNNLISADNRIRDEMKTRIDKAVKYRNDNPNKPCYILIGQLVLDGYGNVQTDVKTQMDILPSGYFVALIGDPSEPLSFRAYGYKPLDVDLNAIIRQPFANIGILHLSPLSIEEEASLTGKVVLEGSGNVSNTKIEAEIRRLYNTPGNFSSSSFGRYENLNYNQTPIRIAVDASGAFQRQGFPPTEYTLIISAPGYVSQRKTIKFQSGKTLDMGTILLELPKKITLTYTGSGLNGNKLNTTAPQDPDKRWKPQLDGHWNLSFSQNRGKISLTSFYCPWYASDLGEGNLDDFKGIENENRILIDQPSNFEINDGHVYLVKSYEGKWLLFKAKID